MTETKHISAHVHNWNDQRWDSNSCWSNHMLGDNLFSTSLLVPQLVVWVTFSVSDNHDQELVVHNVTKHLMVATTVWVSPLFITVELVTLIWFCLSRNLSWLCQWHFAQLTTVKKSWLSNWPWSQKCHEACIGHTNRFEYHLWLSQSSTWRWHWFCFSQICFMTLTVTFCNTYCHPKMHLQCSIDHQQ